ncbi:hypothetical protein BGP_6576 [Beggiatoa sp. PS]|nr:hypothetical protein BGP_6576 [Beggiatoa sp. PS]
MIAQGHIDLRSDLAHTRMNLATCLYSRGEVVL